MTPALAAVLAVAVLVLGVGVYVALVVAGAVSGVVGVLT